MNSNITTYHYGAVRKVWFMSVFKKICQIDLIVIIKPVELIVLRRAWDLEKLDCSSAKTCVNTNRVH